MELISVIVPVYNPGIHLKRCLDSIVGQTWENLQIILIDDGSTDNSLDICRSYAEKDSRIKVLTQKNAGVSAARNRGLREACGDYYSIIDSDDYLEPDAYEYLMELMHTHSCDAVNYEHYITYPNREILHRLPDENYGLMDREQTMYQLVYHVAFAWNKLYSKKIINGLTFNEGIARGEDSLFALAALNRADKVWFDKRPLLHYVQSEQSAVRGKFRPSQLTALKLYDENYPFFSQHYPELLDKWLSRMGELLISLYYDMESDREDYSDNQKTVCRYYRKYYPEAISCRDLNAKQKLKLRLFRISPRLFCIIHKDIH